MSGFHTASKWLKISLFLIHLSFLLLFFPLATVTNMAAPAMAAMIVTCICLISACALTFSWVYVTEVRHNRLYHLITMAIDFLAGLMGIVTVSIIFEWRDNIRRDNVIEATLATSALAIAAAIFTILDMKRTKVGMIEPANMKVDQAVIAGNIENARRSKIIEVKSRPSGDLGMSTKDEDEDRFPKVPVWLKLAFYLQSLALVMTFMPVEPDMHGGTRELTSLTYLVVMVTCALLFSWVFLKAPRIHKAVHIMTVIFSLLTGISVLVTAILWMTTATAIHSFTAAFYFGAGILSVLTSAFLILEMKQFKVHTQRGYCDRDCAAKLFNGYIRVFNVQGITVVLSEDNMFNGDVADRYGAKGSPAMKFSVDPERQEVKDSSTLTPAPAPSTFDTLPRKSSRTSAQEGPVQND